MVGIFQMLQQCGRILFCHLSLFQFAEWHCAFHICFIHFSACGAALYVSHVFIDFLSLRISMYVSHLFVPLGGSRAAAFPLFIAVSCVVGSGMGIVHKNNEGSSLIACSLVKRFNVCIRLMHVVRVRHSRADCQSSNNPPVSRRGQACRSRSVVLIWLKPQANQVSVACPNMFDGKFVGNHRALHWPTTWQRSSMKT